MNISYNSGYNYEPFIQYDDYGAVIQVEDVPIHYDYYGRIVQAGNIVMDYNRYGRLAHIGSLRLHYNNVGRIVQRTGYINSYNQYYKRQPWHSYYRRPSVHVSVVFNQPYRAYYEPRRVSYHHYTTVYNTHYKSHKHKRNFYRPSQKVAHYQYGKHVKSKRKLVNHPGRSYNRNELVRERQHVSRQKSYDTRSRSNISRKQVINPNENTRAQQQESYSGRSERSTNTHGRSRVPTKQIISRNAQRDSRVEAKIDNSKVRRTTRTTTTTRKVEKSPGVRERGGSSKREVTPQRSSRKVQHSKDRATNRSRSSRVDRKNSSRTNGSARNVNNI